ncbi:MAG: tyrosine-type recombinase/integrase [Verrucomicrobiota bacterium]
MATTYRTEQSKYWFARYFDGSGKRISRSTKTESRREAKRIAADLESKARKAEKNKNRDEQEVPKMIRRTMELASLEMQQGKLTLQRAEQLIREMHQAASPEDTGSNFRRFSGAWLDAKENNLAAGTYRGYADAVKLTNRILGAKADGPMRLITVGDMENLQAEISKGRRGKTTNYYISTIRRILESAVQKDIIPKNPAASLTGRGVGDSTPRKEFTPPEVKQLLAHADVEGSDWRGLILMAAHTGLRCGDLKRLTSDNIVGGRLQHQPSKGKKKSGDVVEIPLRPECVEWLEGRTGVLFPTVKAMNMHSIPTVFSRIMKAAGVANIIILAAGDPPVIARRSFHSLRHSFASWLANADIPADVRQRLTGHKSSAVHAKYTHHDEALNRAIASLPDLIDQPTPAKKKTRSAKS